MGEFIAVITVIVSIIALIVFFTMSSNIAAMQKDIRQIEKYIRGYAKENGYGILYTCSTCKKTFEGKQAKCPHCNREVNWKN